MTYTNHELRALQHEHNLVMLYVLWLVVLVTVGTLVVVAPILIYRAIL